MDVKLSELPLVILAGGRASRLGDKGIDCPKYLQPITDEKVFADFHLQWVKEQGFTKLIFSLGYLGEQVEAFLKNYSNTFQIQTISDGSKPLGTGGAVKKAAQLIHEDHFCLTYGDTLLDFPVAKAFDKFQASGNPCLMTVLPNKVEGHIANVHLHAGKALYNKATPPPQAQHIDYGFLFLKTEFAKSFPHEPPFDLADPLTTLARANNLSAFEATNPFKEIGTPTALQKVRTYFWD